MAANWESDALGAIVRIRGSGRLGKLALIDHSTEQSHRVTFDDGKQPPADWFKAADVAQVDRLATRGIVQTELGGVHYVTSGSFHSKLTPILAFHMSPRSVDEYKEAMPILSKDGRLVVAIDEVGYGSSDNPRRSCTLEEIAEGALLVAEHLCIESFIACGSLMGNFFSLSLASKYPERVKAVVLTNCYMWPDEVVAQKKEALAAAGDGARLDQPVAKPVDDFVMKEDGSHLNEIFDTRKTWLTPEMNTRVTRDALIYNLKRRERYAEGINIQDGPLFDFESTARNTKCPCLAINGEQAVEFFNAIGFQFSAQFEKTSKYFADLTVAEKVPGHINGLNTNANEWTAEVEKFLEKSHL